MASTQYTQTVTIRSVVKEIEDNLKLDLDNEKVMKRRGPGGTILEYLTAFASTDELNTVFGSLGWSFDIEQWNKTGEDKIKSKKCKALNEIVDDKNEEIEKRNKAAFDAFLAADDDAEAPVYEELLPHHEADVTMIGIECIGRLSVFVDGRVLCSKEDVGYGEGLGPNAVRAHADAGKQARSDSLKRCAKDFGYRLGLALYDKTQAHVTTKEEEK